MGRLKRLNGCVKHNGARATMARHDICYANGCGDLTAKCDADETTLTATRVVLIWKVGK